jgi:hypothetical protein
LKQMWPWQVSSSETAERMGKGCRPTMSEHDVWRASVTAASNDTLAFHDVHIAIERKLAELFDMLARSWPVNL